MTSRGGSVLRRLGVLYDSTLILCRPLRGGGQRGELEELTDVDDILSDCRRTGREASPERTRQRAALGLDYFSLRQQGTPIAGTWLVRGGLRFLDESMLAFQLGPRAACLRDVFVHPDHRGRGVFARLVDALEAGPLREGAELWSFVEAANGPSRLAHGRSGFVPRGWSTALTGWDRLMWRRHELPPSLPCPAFLPRRHVLWLGREARAYRRANLA